MERTEYERVYPNYCRRCQGWGMFKRLSPDVYFWDCECITNRRCPRCGENALNNMDTCIKCGWHRDEINRGLPGSLTV